METATLPTTEQTVTTEQTTQETENKTVPYSRFSQINTEKKALELKLAEYEAKQTEAARIATEQAAKESGDYQTLIAQVTKEREAEKVKLNSMVKSTYLESLATKHQIAKPEYLALFSAEVEISDMEIKNAATVASAFELFKTENPNLFIVTDKKVVKTDNMPVKQVNTTKAATELSGVDLMRVGMEEFLKNK